MNIAKDIKDTIAILKEKRLFKSQEQIAEKLGYNKSYFSRILNSDDIPIEFEEKFFKEFPRQKYLATPADFFDHVKEPEPKYNPTLKDVSKRLKEIQNQGENPSRVIDDSELVDSIEIIIPYKGQAGLESKMYPEEMVEDFKRVTIKTKPQHRGVFYRIEVDGNSMPPNIQPKDWVRCEETSKLFWTEDNFFKPDKIYCIWHNERGIIFKRIHYRNGGLWCVSDNEDKKRYPDFELQLGLVDKILIVRNLVSREL